MSTPSATNVLDAILILQHHRSKTLLSDVMSVCLSVTDVKTTGHNFLQSSENLALAD